MFDLFNSISIIVRLTQTYQSYEQRFKDRDQDIL